MMPNKPILDRKILNQLFRYNASLGINRLIKGIDYGRVIELPVFAVELLKRRHENLNYLDIGSGDSILPTFIASRSLFNITVIDKHKWIQKQYKYIRKIDKENLRHSNRFTVLEQNFLETSELQDVSFDIITAISVLEHINGRGDIDAMTKIYKLLKPGGIFLFSAPYNHTKPFDYYMDTSIYGEKCLDGKVFFQRHYNQQTLKERIIDSTPFAVENLFFAGHYNNFNFAKNLYILRMPFKIIKLLYNWATPFYVPYFLKLSLTPPKDDHPKPTTADTVFVFMKKN